MELTLASAVDWLVTAVEAAGALVIVVGTAAALGRFLVVVVRSRRTDAFTAVRLRLGRYLALALEFQLAADLLRTAVGPTMQEIVELAAIATIRTALNYFLSREISRERAELADHPVGGLTPDPIDDLPADRGSGAAR
ncbi:DUF1622 domain-containing protein [Pilimelia columellifera]|uniref:DUF1622 domain-containing protein n=1 Tax=Pilimelia columellifera subsp. columellifera TaxID=706583 RepID=A0ABP6AHN2_9ACTN